MLHKTTLIYIPNKQLSNFVFSFLKHHICSSCGREGNAQNMSQNFTSAGNNISPGWHHTMLIRVDASKTVGLKKRWSGILSRTFVAWDVKLVRAHIHINWHPSMKRWIRWIFSISLHSRFNLCNYTSDQFSTETAISINEKQKKEFWNDYCFQ